jgi:AmmeMemoRadiSam system protein B
LLADADRSTDRLCPAPSIDRSIGRPIDFASLHRSADRSAWQQRPRGRMLTIQFPPTARKPTTEKTHSEREYARLLAPYFDESGNNNNLFIISTDFCHYGSRFNYEPFSGDADTDEGPIWRRIAQLDAEGMRLIEAGGDPASFRAYLSRTGNTICGRYPCSLLMATASASSQKNVSFGFRYYDQSSKVVDPRRDSSVSYASALVCVEE